MPHLYAQCAQVRNERLHFTRRVEYIALRNWVGSMGRRDFDAVILAPKGYEGEGIVVLHLFVL